MLSQKVTQAVTPANPGSESGTGAGVQKFSIFLDSGFRRNDGKGRFRICYEFIKV
jgi:hypothetical protein